MLAGQMDYTPGGFLNVTKKDFKQQTPTLVMNTRCAELSKFVIYESPFTVYCDDPDHITGQPGADFLRLVPTVWDDIKVLDGYPGEYLALAKRSGNNWFIGAMTNESKRMLTVQLDFLSPGNYEMEIWQDAKDAGEQPTHLDKVKKTIKAGEKIKIDMKEGGGYVAMLRAL
jgi:alpha-glucosidase